MRVSGTPTSWLMVHGLEALQERHLWNVRESLWMHVYMCVCFITVPVCLIFFCCFAVYFCIFNHQPFLLRKLNLWQVIVAINCFIKSLLNAPSAKPSRSHPPRTPTAQGTQTPSVLRATGSEGRGWFQSHRVTWQCSCLKSSGRSSDRWEQRSRWTIL